MMTTRKAKSRDTASRENYKIRGFQQIRLWVANDDDANKLKRMAEQMRRKAIPQMKSGLRTYVRIYLTGDNQVPELHGIHSFPADIFDSPHSNMEYLLFIQALEQSQVCAGSVWCVRTTQDEHDNWLNYGADGHKEHTLHPVCHGNLLQLFKFYGYDAAARKFTICPSLGNRHG